MIELLIKILFVSFVLSLICKMAKIAAKSAAILILAALMFFVMFMDGTEIVKKITPYAVHGRQVEAAYEEFKKIERSDPILNEELIIETAREIVDTAKRIEVTIKD